MRHWSTNTPQTRPSEKENNIIIEIFEMENFNFFYTYLFDKQDIIGIEDQELIILPQLVEQI